MMILLICVYKLDSIFTSPKKRFSALSFTPVYFDRTIYIVCLFVESGQTSLKQTKIPDDFSSPVQSETTK